MNLELLTRPCLRDVTPYFPGKPIAEVQRELGLTRVVKLASNENFLGASPRAVRALARSAKKSFLYPEGSSPLLRRAIAKEYGVLEGQVILGNGSDEIIRLLCETLLLPDDEVVCSQYGFIRFKQQSMMMGAKVIEVPMADWTHDLETIGRTASSRTKMVFVASPNNPTGTYNTKEQLQGPQLRVPKAVDGLRQVPRKTAAKHQRETTLSGRPQGTRPQVSGREQEHEEDLSLR